MAVVPSENVAVRVRVVPGANSIADQSDANSTNVPPSGTVKFTVFVAGLLMSGASRVVATPNAQKPLLELVSQVPGPVLSSFRPAIPPRPPSDLVTVSVPSGAPSEFCAALP